jgi:hypothetical protein
MDDKPFWVSQLRHDINNVKFGMMMKAATDAASRLALVEL